MTPVFLFHYIGHHCLAGGPIKGTENPDEAEADESDQSRIKPW